MAMPRYVKSYKTMPYVRDGDLKARGAIFCGESKIMIIFKICAGSPRNTDMYYFGHMSIDGGLETFRVRLELMLFASS